MTRILVEHYGFLAIDQPIQGPKCVTLPPLSADELEASLKLLEDWEQVETPIPGRYPKYRQELRKSYTFSSFETAMKFMRDAVQPINQFEHHPRWENQ